MNLNMNHRCRGMGKIALWAIGVVCASLFVYLAFEFIAYFAPHWTYGRLCNHNPGTRSELEKLLPWHTFKTIEKTESLWLSTLETSESDTFVLYNILGIPESSISAAYRTDGSVIAFYGDYE